jgi:retinol dehydrogenase 12
MTTSSIRDRAPLGYVSAGRLDSGLSRHYGCAAMGGNLVGRTILITGATSGIGKSAAFDFARRGARLILASRSETKLRAVVHEISAATGNRAVDFVPVDLSDLSAVRGCADAVNAMAGPLHVVVNNAGQAGGAGLSKDGFELTFATNHLGPFLLTLRLIDKLAASAPARIVNVASGAHRAIKAIDFDALRRPRQTFTGLHEYGVSKLANILFTKALARRLAGSGITTYVLHPGVVATDIWRRIPALVRGLMKLFMSSNDEGARTIIHCATGPEAANESGLYYEKERAAKPTAVAEDSALAERLWAMSAAWVGEDLVRAPGRATGG